MTSKFSIWYRHHKPRDPSRTQHRRQPHTCTSTFSHVDDSTSRASSLLAELTLKLSGRFEAKRANTPLQGERGLNILPEQAVEIQLQPNEEWADLPSLLHLPPSRPASSPSAEAHHGLQLSRRAHVTAFTLTAGFVLLPLVIIRQASGSGGAAVLHWLATPGVCMSERPRARRWHRNCCVSVPKKSIHSPISFFFFIFTHFQWKSNNIGTISHWNPHLTVHTLHLNSSRRGWGALCRKHSIYLFPTVLGMCFPPKPRVASKFKLSGGLGLRAGSTWTIEQKGNCGLKLKMEKKNKKKVTPHPKNAVAIILVPIYHLPSCSCQLTRAAI